jgi:predicted AAA+ superfamily ATPase
MHPMSFSEFLFAIGQKKSSELINSYELGKKISQLIHDKLMDLLRLYVGVGGMPEAVDVYQKTGSLLEVAKVQESIIKSLEYDFAKYGSSVQQRIMGKLLRYVPKTIGQKFKYVNFDTHLRSYQIKDALELLNLSRILHIVYTTNSVTIPLKTGVNEKTFKNVFLDIGLASHILNLSILDLKEMVLNNEGNIAEQVVAQEIIASQSPYTDREIYYWVREKQSASSEIDYLIKAGNKVMPVEVKAGKTGSLKSLNVFMAEKKMNMAFRFNADLPSVAMSEMSIVLKDKSVKTKFKLISLPLYLSGEIDRIISSY